MIFLHFLLGALVLPVGLDHPAHDEDVGATRVELAVVGESHPELPLGLSHLPVFVEQFVFALVDELRLWMILHQHDLNQIETFNVNKLLI